MMIVLFYTNNSRNIVSKKIKIFKRIKMDWMYIMDNI